MKFQELIERFYFDGYFVDYEGSQHLLLSPVYSHSDLLKISPNIEGDYHIEVVEVPFMRLRVAICSDDYCAEKPILFIETEKSFERRSHNCCDNCEEDFSSRVFGFGYANTFNTKVLNSWNPLNNERLQIDHNREISGQICLECREKDPALAKYIVNTRVLNSMV